MSRHDVIDDNFRRFVQQFNIEDQNALLAFYRELVGKRVIPYKIKDHIFEVRVQSCQGFMLDMEFQDVLIEDGRHPKEILMENLRGEVLPDGRYRFIFVNRLSSSADKESSFSFSAFCAKAHFWDYSVHTLELTGSTQGFPWNILYETLCSIEEKHHVLGVKHMNGFERKALGIFEFMKPYMELYLMPTTKIGFGRSTVLVDPERINWNLTEKSQLRAADFFAGLGLRRLSEGFESGKAMNREFIKEVLYTMRSLKGNIIYRTLRQTIESSGRQYKRLYESKDSMRMFHTYISDKINQVFQSHGWTGSYPSYSMVLQPEFIEVSNVYSKQYSYLNEKVKFIYFDFIESIVDGKYQIVPVTGMMLPKNSNIDYRKCTSIDCFFLDSGRRNGAIFEDLIFTEDMPKKEVKNHFEQLGIVLDLQS